MTESADKAPADVHADEGDGKFNPYRDERPMTKEQRDEWLKKNPGGRLLDLDWPSKSE